MEANQAQSIRRNISVLTHLFFADDLLPFREASMHQMEVILDCLRCFYSLSGQKISLQKYSITFSKGVDATLTNEIFGIAGIPIASQLGKYLGVPFITGRVPMGLFQIIWIASKEDLKAGKLNV